MECVLMGVGGGSGVCRGAIYTMGAARWTSSFPSKRLPGCGMVVA